MITKEQVRGALIAHLAKEGRTIKDAEEKMEKDAAFGAKDAYAGAAGLLKLLFGTAGIAGGLGGIGLYGGYRMLENSDDKMQEALEVKRRLHQAREELESAHLQNQMGGQLH